MCIAVEKEWIVAGFVNTHADGLEFTLDDIYDYILSLWNTGCGPVRLILYAIRCTDIWNYVMEYV